MNKHKLLLSGALLIATQVFALPALAATTVTAGDTSSGQVVFSGYVPGFVSGDTFTITGAGGVMTSQYTGSLSISPDGTFSTLAPIILEGHAYDGTGSTPLVGALTPAEWTVKSINTSNPILQAALENVELTDTVAGGKITSISLGKIATAANSVSLSLSMNKAITDEIAGQTFTVDVVMVATAS
ncbi:hypothetical protein L4C31_01365 [Aliivibrio sifiae]